MTEHEQDWKKMAKDYTVRGSTALLDAIGGLSILSALHRSSPRKAAAPTR